ncbi:hypothetical protein QUF99_14170 [Bacillus sp. DX4.1]|uniref:hypothetical protein n=1 Tax=Bacillus sp. DX4.1 TaxID=3055867 RepID=UPI0025A20B28|nr:hypothetical protein [Bacillus sp. DX4.1]MDM5188420.1 hypothetical protein [Bacillus sp. DX4.1]
MFYKNQQPYPQQPHYQQNFGQQYPEQQYQEPQQQEPQYQQPQMYQPYYNPRVSPPAPTLDPAQIQISPPVPTTPAEPTPQQIQQAVGTQFLSLKQPVLNFVKPWVDYEMKEAKHTSPQHAMTEIAAIMFLIGKGYNPTIAHYIVESWEKNEQF